MIRWRTLALALLALALWITPKGAAAAGAKNQKRPAAESGIASWFRTRHPLSAAHRTLPFGTKVKVTAKNGKSVVVTINDRGPFRKGRVIDLSSDAFKEIASLKAGVVLVQVETLPPKKATKKSARR